MAALLEKARRYEKEAAAAIPIDNRPVFHFSVPTGWMNDPNGFSDYKGEHHLFFQYNPYDTHWDTMHWGHAKSSDFILWEYLPAALAPDQDYDNAGAFSGSALEDGDKQILIYTGVEEKEIDGHMQIRQTQCIAAGNGTDYEKLSSNPVITPELLPAGSSTADFRDPKIWKDGQIYYTVTGSRHADGSGQIALFYSEDLKSWHFGSILDRSKNELGKMWECPDFFALDGSSILLVSPQDMLAEGVEFHSGNNSICLLGSYDKKNMRFVRESVHNVDYGLDFYASQTMLSSDGRRILIAWMQSWDTCMCPEEQSWYGMMTCPRELSVKNGRLYQTPVRELERYRKDKVSFLDVLCDGRPLTLEGISGRALDLSVRLKAGDYRKFKIQLAADETYYSEIIYDREEKLLTFDRSHSGSRRDFINNRSMEAEEENGILDMRILMDKYSVEIFVNEGKRVMSSVINTPQSAAGVIFESKGYVLIDITKYDIEVMRW